MLLFPGKNTTTIDEFHPSKKLFHTLQESEEWGKMLNIDTVGALDDAIAAGKMRQVIMVQEALMEKKIGQLAETIASVSYTHLDVYKRQTWTSSILSRRQ